MAEKSQKPQTTEARSFEEALQRLEVIVRQLESGEAPLKESIALYEEAQELKRFCEAELETAEKRISELQLDKDGTRPTGEAPFDA